MISETKLKSRKVSTDVQHFCCGSISDPRSSTEPQVNLMWRWAGNLPLGKLSSSLLSTMCFLPNNAFFNYFTLVSFPGAHCTPFQRRESSVCWQKAPEDVEPDWKGGFPCLCCHLAQRAVHVVGFRGSPVLGFIPGRGISHPQEATQKKLKLRLAIFQQPDHFF